MKPLETYFQFTRLNTLQKQKCVVKITYQRQGEKINLFQNKLTGFASVINRPRLTFCFLFLDSASLGV